jgi:hypothetical protein
MKVSNVFLRDQVALIIAQPLQRRRAFLEQVERAPQPNGPPTEFEIDMFLFELRIDYRDPLRKLASTSIAHRVVADVPRQDLDEFLSHVRFWSRTTNYIDADLYMDGRALLDEVEAAVPQRVRQELYQPDALRHPRVFESLSIHAPSIALLHRLSIQQVDLDRLSWRELERLIAELLEADGYDVELRGGTQDGGVDIIAYRDVPSIGSLKTVWQAKHRPSGGKIGLNVVRELADITSGERASKGIIVTTGFLTAGALERIERDTYRLAKVERTQLEAWIERILDSR